jgi:TrmH family RNA methyltransferase
MEPRQEILTSLSNPKFKDLLDIKENGKKRGLVLVEGEDLIDLAIKAKALTKIVVLAYDYRYRNFEEVVLSPELYRRLSSYNSLPKAMGVASFSLADSFSDNLIYLDGIQDPGNLGTIERSCLAFGFTSLALSKDSVSPLNFKAVQASKGAFFSLKIGYAELSDLKEQGFRLCMTTLDGTDIKDVKKPAGKFAVVIGNEGQGIRKEHLALADQKIFLPINPLIDSLNAAIAASIVMYLWRN